MNKNKISNIKLSLIYGLPVTNTHINKRITDTSVENVINSLKEIELENKNNINSKNTDKNLQTIIKLSDKIIYSNQSQLNNKNQFNLNLSKLENLKKEFSLVNLNELNTILINERQYIKLITSFNSNLASYTNNIYTFTNKPYKQINKNLHNLYIICKSAFLNMSSIISKPIVSIKPNLIKITLFYY
jgi:hypothetical protein